MIFLNRRSIRLKHYDYSQQGAYFLTICTKHRQCLFGHIKHDKIQLNNLGLIVVKCWLEIPFHFPHVELDMFVIMPNHIHGILSIIESINNESQYSQYGKVIKGSIPSIIRSFKAGVTKEINQICQQKGTSLIWQRTIMNRLLETKKCSIISENIY